MKKKIENGIYIIVDPSMKRTQLISKLKKFRNEKITAIQIWDNFKSVENPTKLIEEIHCLCRDRNIPLLINNRWDLLQQTNADGIHFDEIPENLVQLKQNWDKELIIGITCGNDLSVVKWANENNLDYISFCSLFPSSTANSCELVSLTTIKKAREITSIPIFLAGGIQPENIKLLDDLPYSGIAVVSGIMNANNPTKALIHYQQELKKTQN